MYINFQQKRVSRSVKTVHTNLFTNNRELHDFAPTNSNFEKKLIISDMHHRIMFQFLILCHESTITTCEQQINNEIFVLHENNQYHVYLLLLTMQFQQFK